MEEKEDQQRLKQKPLLTPRLILTCCMEDIMDMDMVDTTGENKQPQQQNIKETPKHIVKSAASNAINQSSTTTFATSLDMSLPLSLPEYKLGNISCSARVHPHPSLLCT